MATDAQSIYELAPWGAGVAGLTIWGDSPFTLVVTVTQVQTGVANIKVTTTRNQTGVANIDSPIKQQHQTGIARIVFGIDVRTDGMGNVIQDLATLTIEEEKPRLVNTATENQGALIHDVKPMIADTRQSEVSGF